MRACPTCKRKYSPGMNYCPEDGTPLAEKDPLLGTRLSGDFDLERICGTGSMGTVYLAWQSTMERHVAIKILRRDLQDTPQLVKRFQREARAAAQLAHPNIITVFSVGETDDERPFIVMEYIDGPSLDDLTHDLGTFPIVRAIHITRQIASALAEAHDRGIIHRDLKPANILLAPHRTTPDVVKVVDFGIAKILHETEETQITQTGAIFGTPFYLSPEQASGAEIDPRC
ncbi:MAG: serine/threonine protein kinase, partial [Deltaproteobacteria bacterium]|nr:serine/threonine protein kinase [Deltaproteobacteria bacterium]